MKEEVEAACDGHCGTLIFHSPRVSDLVGMAPTSLPVPVLSTTNMTGSTYSALGLVLSHDSTPAS
jgi:hypothetical protein